MPRTPAACLPAFLSRAAVAAGLGLAVAAVAVAHPDDPKVRDKLPRHEGPGWTEASDAAGPQFGAEGVTLRSWISLPEFGTNPASGNDCWGWTSPAGREYALMGLNNGTAIVEVTDPGMPQIRSVIPGPSSLWRDVKTYGHHAYVVTEATNGNIQVIDLAPLDATGQATLVNTVGGPGTSQTHNVAIDTDSGFLYRSGGGSEGIRIYDLTDPVSPQFVASWSTKYVHDLQARTMTSGPFAGRELVFLCGGFNGGWVDTGITILDVTDKSNLVVVDEFLYPFSAYSHQAWLTEDGTKLYLNDELDEGEFGIGTTIHVFDVSNPADIVYEGAFTNGNPAIGHNLYVAGNLLYSANYRSGLRVFDLSTDPLAPAEVAWFDTFPDSDSANFNGAWSVYPYFASGTVLISDLERGLFMVEVAQPRVAVSYPEGRPEIVNPSGQVVRAQLEELVDGSLKGASVRLLADDGAGPQSAAMLPAGGGVWQGTLPSTTCGATVAWWIEVTFADEEVVTSPANAPASAWTATSATGRVAILDDDGQTPAGWTVSNIQITGGAWQRGVPAGLGDRGDPTVDFDGSGACWLTENGPGNTDVDGGPTILTSREIPVPADGPLVLRYARWFTNDDADIDRLRTEYSPDGGATWLLVEQTGGFAGWEERTVRLDAVATPGAVIRVRFLATDNPNDSVTEAAIDAVRLEVLECNSTEPQPEDVDGDGVIGFGDLLAILAAFGPCEGGPCPADVDGDGAVSFNDLLAVLAAWD